MSREWKEFKWEDIPNDFFTGKYEVECPLSHVTFVAWLCPNVEDEWVSFTNLEDIISLSKNGTMFRYRRKFVPTEEEIKIIVRRREDSTRVELVFHDDLHYVEHRNLNNNDNGSFLERTKQMLDAVADRENEQ